MTFQNVQLKNSGNDEGDILNFFDNELRSLVQKNGGDHTFSFVCEEFRDKDPPMALGLKTKMRLTHSAHTISQIEKGFINMKIEFRVKFDKPIEEAAFKKDYNDLNQIFIGFKDAVELFSEIRFFIDGQLVDYAQTEAIRESYAYNVIRPRDVKKSAPHAHSLWEDVSNYMPNVCGVYVPLSKFQGGKSVKVQFELVIPFTDQLVLQAWRLYPNRILGEIEEEVKTSLEALVWCQVPPKAIADVQKFWGCDLTEEVKKQDEIEEQALNVDGDADYTEKEPTKIPTVHDAPPFVPITTNFTQLGNPSQIVVSVKDSNGVEDLRDRPLDKVLGSGDFLTDKLTVWSCEERTLSVVANSGHISMARTNCAGFGITQEVIEGLMSSLENPIIIPAQELTRHIFENSPSANGFSTLSKSIPLHNATNITMMFPRSTLDCTVFQNIMYEKCQLFVNKKLYPDMEFEDTFGGRFVQYQLMANELDGPIEATEEYMRSIDTPLNDAFHRFYQDGEGNGDLKPRGQRRRWIGTDNTNFGINFQLERGNAGYVFDGIDTGTHSITVQFKGSPIYSNELDSYYNPRLASTYDGKKLTWDLKNHHPPAPEMWICSDTYWTWSIQDGVKYYHLGIPEGYN